MAVFCLVTLLIHSLLTNAHAEDKTKTEIYKGSATSPDGNMEMGTTFKYPADFDPDSDTKFGSGEEEDEGPAEVIVMGH